MVISTTPAPTYVRTADEDDNRRRSYAPATAPQSPRTPPRMESGELDGSGSRNLPPPTPYTPYRSGIPSASGRRPRPLRPGEDFLTDREPELPPSHMPMDSPSGSFSEPHSVRSGRVGFQNIPVEVIGTSYGNGDDHDEGSVRSNRSIASGSNKEDDAASNVSQQSSMRSSRRSAAGTDVPGDVPFAPSQRPANPAQYVAYASMPHLPTVFPFPLRPQCPVPAARRMYHTTGNARLDLATPRYWASATARSRAYTVHVGEAPRNGSRVWLAVIPEGERTPAVTIEGGYLSDPPTAPCRVVRLEGDARKVVMKLFARRGRTEGDVRIVMKKVNPAAAATGSDAGVDSKKKKESTSLATSIVPATLDVPCWPPATIDLVAPPGMEGATISSVVVNGARIRGGALRRVKKNGKKSQPQQDTSMRLVTSADAHHEWVQTGEGLELASVAHSFVPELVQIPPFARYGHPSRLMVKDGVDIAVVASVLASRLWVYVLKGRGY